MLIANKEKVVGLLVEYTLMEGMADAQVEALQSFVAGLKDIGDEGYSYTAFETNDPTKFIGLLEFDDDAAKQRFIESAPFAAYRDGAKDRFAAPPNATPIRRVATTR